MSENQSPSENQSTERLGRKHLERITQLETALKALLTALKNLEEDQGEAYMPEGTYLGVKFEDE